VARNVLSKIVLSTMGEGMSNQNFFRLAACAAVLALAAASSFAGAAEGNSCALRVAGPQGTSGATLGHVNADGKCVSTAAPKAKESDGLEASAQCRDLSYSYNKRRNSACAKHGGVLEWLAQQ
jgi:hypothetical protein